MVLLALCRIAQTFGHGSHSQNQWFGCAEILVLNLGTNRVGSDSANHFASHPSVSKHHCDFIVTAEALWLRTEIQPGALLLMESGSSGGVTGWPLCEWGGLNLS